MSFSNQQEQGRPVTIKDEGITLVSNVGSIDFTGAGVTGSAIGSAVTENIPGGSGGTWTEETPTGTIDGVNTSFTLSAVPIANSLYLELARQPQVGGGVDYTLSGSTITYVIAPDASLSGQPHRARYQK